MSRVARRLGLTVACLISMLAIGVGPAQAVGFGLIELDATYENEDTTAATLAGSHPFRQITTLGITTEPSSKFSFEIPTGDLKDLGVVLPPGFVADTTAIPTCSQAAFVEQQCEPDTQIGMERATISEPNFVETTQLFNLNPAPGTVAKFGFVVLQVPVVLEIRLSERYPYNGLVTASNVPQTLPIYKAVTTVWGVPYDAAHDSQRKGCASGCTLGPVKPFLTMPTSCAGSVYTDFRATDWQEPSALPTEGASAHSLTVTGCDEVAFGPTIDNATTTAEGESPSGLDFDLNFSDQGLQNPEGRSESALEKAVVTLPEGLTTNPAVAGGLGACTLAEYEAETLDSTAVNGCPEDSKVGSVDIVSPLIAPTLDGSIYVAKQGDNPFDNLLTIYMVAKNPQLGIIIKAAGRVEPDPKTGRLTTTFEELPELPFSHFHLHLREGRQAPLITPATCGTYTTTADLYPYSSPGSPLRDTATFTVERGANGANCASDPARLPNVASFSAGTVDSSAASFSPFVLNLSREDGSQQLSRIDTTLPAGLLGRLAGIPYCSDAQIAEAASRSGEGQGEVEIARPSCPASSEVGTVTVGSGAGPQPYYVKGRVYLAGPYKGAPLSLEIVTPAVAGPFDLGVVAVRTALRVDPLTTQITAESDPIPTILHGLPLDVRSIALQVDRPSFTLNPTGCEPKAITGSVTSTLGSVAPLRQYFQASNCAALKFKPKLQLSLNGSARHAGHPALKAVLTYPQGGGYANIARAQVNLPHSEFIDQGNLNKTCTKPVLLEEKCPASTIYGRAKAWTPLLEAPLEGPVYLVGGFGYKLPALVAELNGQIRVLLVGRVDSGRNHGIRNTFEAVPDAPVEKFELRLKGGKKYSLLENSEDLCTKPQRAAVRFVAQSGVVRQWKVKITHSCRGRHGVKKRKKHAPGTDK